MSSPSSSEEFLVTLTRLRRAASELHGALNDLEPYWDSLCADIEAGRDLVELVKEVKDKDIDGCRQRVHAAIRQFEHEMQCMRGQSFLVLVDGAGMTITDAARLSAVSTQMARRLYRAVENCEKSLD